MRYRLPVSVWTIFFILGDDEGENRHLSYTNILGRVLPFPTLHVGVVTLDYLPNAIACRDAFGVVWGATDLEQLDAVFSLFLHELLSTDIGKIIVGKDG